MQRDKKIIFVGKCEHCSLAINSVHKILHARLAASGSPLSVVVVVVVVVIQVGGGVGEREGVADCEWEGEGSTEGPPGRGQMVSFK